jgi:hypothetical protein
VDGEIVRVIPDGIVTETATVLFLLVFATEVATT